MKMLKIKFLLGYNDVEQSAYSQEVLEFTQKNNKLNSL